MVDFTLSEEQQMLQELAHEFATDNVRPPAEHWDENSEFPMEAIKVAHELGLMTLHIPAAYGGMGMGNYGGIDMGIRRRSVFCFMFSEISF